ncbi:MAG: amidohydrolase family protein [Hyphomicrobiales bacterium]|nr:amidohydrolase family protein [Hyphomicrobiales bacterium]
MAELYGGPIIDSHCHLWDLGMDRHPWLRPTGGAVKALGDLDALRRNYLVDDYRRDAANQNVVASVHVEAGWDRADDPLAEIRWLEGLDKSSGVAARYIGFADLAAAGAGAALDRLAEVRRCVGVRQMLSWHPSEPAKSFARRPGIADEADFRRGVALLARHGQLLELMLYPYQAEEVARLARDFPAQTFVVNHCGSPIDRDRDGMLRWRDGLKRLGSAPNVNIKISGLTAYDPSPTPESLREVALHCIECFGVERSMFGSDFPVGRLWTSFDAIFDGFKVIVRDFTEDEQSALFHANARRIYRMDQA